MKRILIGAVLPAVMVFANYDYLPNMAQQQTAFAGETYALEAPAYVDPIPEAGAVSLTKGEVSLKLSGDVTDGSSSETLIVDDPLSEYGPTREDYEKHLEWLELSSYDYYDIPLTAEQQRYVVSICEEYSVPVTLAYGVMYVESNFNPKARSGNGRSYGIMQISRINHAQLKKTLGVKNFLDFEDNVKAGVYMLSTYIKRYGKNYHTSLIIYNCGANRADELFSERIWKTEYSRKVVNYSKSLKKKTLSFEEILERDAANS